MKNAIAILLLVTACGQPNGQRPGAGSYVARFAHEFAMVEDTLRLSIPTDGVGMYLLEKRSGIRRMLDGKTFPKELRTESYVVEYDAVKQVFRDIKRGRLFLWDSKQQALLIGNRTYHPLKK